MPKPRSIVRLTFGLAITSAAWTAAAEPTPDSDQSPIVVTGERMGQDALRDFVRDLTPVGAGGQLSRFEQKVCPIAFGVAPSQITAVEKRIRLVAQAAGIPAGGPKCSPNIVLIVASDKGAVLEELRRYHSDYFGDMSPKRIRALIRSSAPVDAWQVQGAPMSSDGRELHQDPRGVFENWTTKRASRITVSAHPQFQAAVVVVAFDALAGLTVTQVADYVAIRALTGADPAKLGNSGPPTILRAFDVPFGGDVPITMTEWDLAFLRGYYAARRNLATAAQRSAITKSMTDDLQQPQGQ